MKMKIRKLKYEDFAGKRYRTEICSDKYLAIEPIKSTKQGDGGFSFAWVDCEEVSMTLEDELLSEWLENPVAFGAFSVLTFLPIQMTRLKNTIYELKWAKN